MEALTYVSLLPACRMFGGHSDLRVRLWGVEVSSISKYNAAEDSTVVEEQVLDVYSMHRRNPSRIKYKVTVTQFDGCASFYCTNGVFACPLKRVHHQSLDSLTRHTQTLCTSTYTRTCQT